MNNGLCDVKECRGLPLLGWRPLTERIGRKICEKHWRRHQDENDSFDLFDEFKFRRPLGIRKPITKKDAPRCACGRELPPGRRLYTVCATERERQRKRQHYHNKKKSQAEHDTTKESTLQCKQCGGLRLPDHIFCSMCAKRRKTITRRQAQSRYRKKRQND
jgi:hypothetical protein